jgi:hypothetical protein
VSALLIAGAGYSQTVTFETNYVVNVKKTVDVTLTNFVTQTNTVTVTDTNPPQPFISGPLADLFNFAKNGSNFIIAPYAIFAQSSGSKFGAGAGLALGYHINEFVVPTMRLDYLNKQLFMPSASLQLQAPVTLFGKLTVIPFGFSGIATPISGAGANNGSVVGIFGAGGAVRLDFLGSGAFWQHTDVVGDYELWTGGGFNNQKQIRFGLAYKF